MNVSLYQAAAAMDANSKWQDVIAQNLASNTVPGARKETISFSAVEAGLLRGTPGTAGSRVLIPTTSTQLSFQQGLLRPTNIPTDLAVEGPGFFEVQLPNGAHGFSRNGEFHIDAQGQLVTGQGYPVMTDNGPLQLDPANHTPISISSTGEVSQGGEVKGRIRLVEFAQPAQLTPAGNGYFLAKDPSSIPSAAQSSQVRQGYLETANSTPTTEMASLVSAMRMFEANQKVLQMQDDRMGRVITELGNPS
jgi:flagellar basal-body rod protein FlgF